MKTYLWIAAIVISVVFASLPLINRALTSPDLTYHRMANLDPTAPRIPIDETELVKVRWPTRP
jgi:hypothetical protein